VSPRERLIDLIVTHGLERRDVALMVAVDIGTVDRWLLPHDSPQHLEVPEMALQLIEYKLADRPRTPQESSE